MGNYNPYRPQIVGEEWVPIREQGLTLNPFANTVERGYGFTLTDNTQVNNVRFYLKEFPLTFASSLIFNASIYPRGGESASGPIRSVIIPCNYAQATGGGVGFGPAVIFAGLTFADCLYARGDNYFVSWTMGNNTPAIRQGLDIYFATNAYAQLLNGKRILGVDFLTGIDIISQGFDIDTISQTIMTFVRTDFDNTATDTFRLPNLLSNQTPVSTITPIRMRLGDANRFFGVGSGTTAGVNQISQWTYSELQRFEASATNRLHIALEEFPTSAVLGPQFSVEYAALEIFYCEESRAAFGSRIFNDDIPNRPSRDPFVLGMNEIKVRNATTLATNPILTAGDYTVTISESNMGDNFYAAQFRSTATLNQVRQLYTIPSHPGVQVNLPFPLNDTTVGTTFTSESTALIPQLTLHTSGGVVVADSHVYGNQSVAQVYGGTFAAQDILTTQSNLALASYSLTLADTFTRVVANGWGSADTGQAYTTAGGAASDYSVNGTTGLVSIASVGTTYELRQTTVTPADFRTIVDFTDPVLPATSNHEFRIQGRVVSDSVTALVVVRTDNTVTVNLQQSLGGVTTSAGAVTVPGVTATTAMRTIFEAIGSTLRVKVFPISGTEPSAWQLTFVTGVLPSGRQQLRLQLNAGNTNVLPVVMSIDNYQVFTLTAATYPYVRYYARRFGNTTVPLLLDSPTISGAGYTVELTPAEWDDLPEIVDGWKQITKRFGTAPALGSLSDPTWRWTAVGERAGSRWEVLGAAAYAASGIPQQMDINLQFGQVPTLQRLYAGTYGAPVLGGTIVEDWMPQLGPYVSGAAADPAADVAVIFAQDMPTVTGLTVAVASQALTGIGQNCGLNPCGIPSALLYNRVSWSLPSGTGVATDIFNRIVSGSWGTASDGKVWQNTSDAEHSVNGVSGVIAPVGGGDREAWVDVGAPDQDVTVTININALPPTFRYRAGVVARLSTNTNHYHAEMWYESTGVVELLIGKRVAGARTDLAIVQIGSLGASTTADRKIRFQVQGSRLRAKLWAVNLDEPDWWQLDITDTSLTTGNNAGTFVRNDSTGSPVFSFSEFIVRPPDFGFSYLELQRRDTLTDWATIMKATSPAVATFNDYEARIGVSSDYRIRAVSTYAFEGPWSSTATVTIVSPGVSGTCLDQAHIMTFTTNERQNGSSNLAYSNAWEGDVTEEFAFPESGFVQLQPMYNRDFFTAFHPSERGGDQFSRNLLVQAAAISPETLADFTSLRDMAWADVSYVCVRDEDGNRWFANVAVPAAVVKNSRKLYLATIQITEVTATPSPADPTAS